MRNFVKVLAMLMAALMMICMTGCDGNKKPYEAAKALIEDGDFAAAADKFAELGDYEDAEQYVKYCRAVEKGLAGDIDGAMAELTEMAGFEDSGLYLVYFTGRIYEEEALAGDADAFKHAGRMYAAATGIADADARRAELKEIESVKLADMIYDFSEGLAVYEYDGKFGYIDMTGKVVVEAQWEQVAGFSEGLAAVYEDGKWGYIDATGAQVIDCSWDYCGDFSGGLAWVGTKVDDETLYGYIDADGRTVVECTYDSAESFSEGFARVNSDGMWGYIDESGALAVGCMYEKAGDFSEGLAAVYVDGKWGYIGSTGDMMLYPRWDMAGKFSEGLACVEAGGLVGYIDLNGEYVVVPQCSVATDYSEGYGKGQLYGYIVFFDANGEMVFSSADWERVNSFGCGRALVKQNGAYGYMDGNFEVAIGLQYEYGGNFVDGYAPVKANGMWFIIDTDGNTVY